MQRETISTTFPLGSALPEFDLAATDGHRYGSTYLRTGKAGLIVFSCNHCPYVKGSEEMLVKIVRRFEPEGLRTLSINANDATKYPDDSFANMKEKALAMHLPYPYLFDESQSVAKLFDAACTPECYLFDGNFKLVFHGTINDSPRDPGKVAKDYLTPALESVLAGKIPEPAFVHPIGCSIKWK